MINKEDIKVGLRFYITKNDCLKCNFDPIGIHGGSTPILFNAERKDTDVYICTSVSTDYRYIARFREKDIIMFGTKFDIVTKGEGESANEKTDADRFKEITDKMSDTYKRKNHDYGNAFSEMYDELGINYGYGKIREKVNRIKTLKDNESQVANEPLEDALLDCANYCILTLMEYQKHKEHGTD